MPLPDAQKLHFERSHGRAQPYADLYRFGGAGPRAPLVLYVGGAIGKGDYLARSRTPPTPIAAEFEKAFELVQPGPVALLVCPCPIDIGGYDGFLEHYDDELVPAAGGRPAALACVGYSNGGQHALFVAVAREARALSLLGAAGMKAAADEARDLIDAAHRNRQAAALPRVTLFKNDRDRHNEPSQLRGWLHGLDVGVAGARHGEHGFGDYAGNGTAVEVFRFVLTALAPAGGRAG